MTVLGGGRSVSGQRRGGAGFGGRPREEGRGGRVRILPGLARRKLFCKSQLLSLDDHFYKVRSAKVQF